MITVNVHSKCTVVVADVFSSLSSSVTGSSQVRPVCLPAAGLNFAAPQTGWITRYVLTTAGGETTSVTYHTVV